MKKKPIPHDEYVKLINLEMQKHPNNREGMQVHKINANLFEMTIPGVDATNPDDFNRIKADVDLQMVFWDSKAIVDKTYSYTGPRISEKMLPCDSQYRNSEEGRGSVLLQSMLKCLYECIMAYKRDCGSWPTDVVPLIEKLKIRDPWNKTEYLKVHYTAPTINVDHQHVLAEYTREGIRKFVLYTDGHQETWKV